MVRAILRDDTRGRPGKGAPPAQVVDHIDGTLASSLTPRRARSAQHRGVLSAPNDLDAPQLMPQALLGGDTGQGQAERGVRFLQDPSVLPSSRYLKKTCTHYGLWMVMTVCVRVGRRGIS
jgi:hypothetical protein